MIRNVLLATDFSQTAESATGWAVEIARTHEARIHLTHVLYLPSPMSPYVLPPPDVSRELQEAAAARLDAARADLDESRVEVTTHLEPGLPSQVLREVALAQSCELIVMGTQGLSGFKHLLLGSTAQRVIQRAPCPVLAIHAGDSSAPRPLRRVLVPTDFSKDAQLASDWVLELLHGQQQGSTLILAHAFQLPVEYTAYGSIPTSWDYLKDVAGVAEEELAQRAQALTAKGWRVETVAVEGAPAMVIGELAKERQVDLIAMGTHGRTGIGHLLLGSSAEKVLQQAACPILVVPRKED